MVKKVSHLVVPVIGMQVRVEGVNNLLTPGVLRSWKKPTDDAPFGEMEIELSANHYDIPKGSIIHESPLWVHPTGRIVLPFGGIRSRVDWDMTTPCRKAKKKAKCASST